MKFDDALSDQLAAALGRLADGCRYPAAVAATLIVAGSVGERGSCDCCQALLPFLEAGRRGLLSSQWRPGAPVEDLLAPIVLHVLAEAARRLRIGELLAETQGG